MSSTNEEKLTNGASSNGVNGSTNCRDGHDYLRIMNKERDRLLAHANKLDNDIEDLLKADVSEEIIGYLRSASGKARLLSSQKMVQFEGLCKKNVDPPPDDPCPTKLQDLQGFWEMICLQIDQIDRAFGEVEIMRANGWTKPPPVPELQSLSVTDGGPSARSIRRTTPKSSPAAPSPASILAAQKREQQRKQLAELKRQFKQAQIKDNGTANADDGGGDAAATPIIH